MSAIEYDEAAMRHGATYLKAQRPPSSKTLILTTRRSDEMHAKARQIEQQPREVKTNTTNKAKDGTNDLDSSQAKRRQS